MSCYVATEHVCAAEEFCTRDDVCDFLRRARVHQIYLGARFYQLRALETTIGMDLLPDCAALAASRCQEKCAGQCVRNAVVLPVFYNVCPCDASNINC